MELVFATDEEPSRYRRGGQEYGGAILLGFYYFNTPQIYTAIHCINPNFSKAMELFKLRAVLSNKTKHRRCILNSEERK